MASASSWLALGESLPGSLIIPLRIPCRYAGIFPESGACVATVTFGVFDALENDDVCTYWFTSFSRLLTKFR